MIYRVEEYRSWAKDVHAGDEILLSGTVYTARDAAHKRFRMALEKDEALPFELVGSFIYYAGPTPAKNALPIGSCGPTTSSRMDGYAPQLYRLGMACTIGKGPRSDDVRKAIVETGGLYLCAIGGAGALAAKAVRTLEVIAYPELGCESVKRLQVEEFPLIVGIDSYGVSLFDGGNA